MRAAWEGLEAERRDEVVLPARLDVDLPRGFFRTMPAAVGEHVGVKIMSLVRGVGNRYLLLLYSQITGDLVAVLDADEVTRRRTAATTAVAGDLLCPAGTDRLGLLGTGFEAEEHLRTLHAQWGFGEVLVHSRSEEHRTVFAERMSLELGITVRSVATSREVVADCPVVALCTKAAVPVLDGTDLAPGAVVLSIGSTRPDLRELDLATLARSAAVLADSPTQVIAESGDIQAGLAAGSITSEQVVAMSEWAEPTTSPGRDLVTFKSVGTAVQDLVLAAELVSAASDRGLGRDLGTLTRLKSVESPVPAGVNR
jgi:alanine dehydrogenase